MQESLLVEILTEELPPKSLRKLAESFCKSLTQDLRDDGLLASDSTSRSYASPRRLAVAISHVLDTAPDHSIERPGPSVKVALGADGRPTQALIGFAKKLNVRVEDLVQIDSAKGKVFAYREMAKGAHLETNLDLKVEEALRKLPVPKIMRWGDGDAQFVRPVHRLVMLHGTRVVPGKVLGLEAGNRTSGHRFMGKGEIALASADEYETRLLKEGMVIADFAARRAEIDRQLKAEASRNKASLGAYEDLLDEVTALVEHPSVYVGGFEASFLDVPQECLILTMRQNQKYFPLFDAGGKLQPNFLIVSNMKLADPHHIIGGNERVVRPRLEDARFFFNQDRKVRLEDRVPQLGKVVYYTKLGSQLDRVERLTSLAGHIAQAFTVDPSIAKRAAWLAKADLLTGMVGEFPELQGVMGRYYARHDGEPQSVADAIEGHYHPRFAGDRVPEDRISCCVALADRADTLVGLFGIGSIPTGEKDPYGLRRAALGIIRILAETPLALDLDKDLLDPAHAGFFAGVLQNRIGAGYKEAIPQVREFLLERLRGYCREKGFTAEEVEAVVSVPYLRIDQALPKLDAIRKFRTLPESESLSGANKRIRNILKQANFSSIKFDPGLHELTEPAEKRLYNALIKTRLAVDEALAKKQDHESFSFALTCLAALGKPVDEFFDGVLVMAEDKKTRESRLALLSDLSAVLNRVADISKLAA